MTLPRTLRLALVPIGVLIASKGLQALSDEADRLGREIDARRAALGIYDHGKPEPDAEQDAEQAADPWAELEEPPRRPARRDVGRLVAAAVGLGVGVYLTTRAHRALRDRAAAELAPGMLPGERPAANAHLGRRAEGTPAVPMPAAPVATEPGCTHPDCILNHPHAGPALFGHAYPCPDDCPCQEYK